MTFALRQSAMLTWAAENCKSTHSVNSAVMTITFRHGKTEATDVIKHVDDIVEGNARRSEHGDKPNLYAAQCAVKENDNEISYLHALQKANASPGTGGCAALFAMRPRTSRIRPKNRT